MANQGNLKLSLTDPRGRPVDDPDVGIRILRADGKVKVDERGLKVRPPDSTVLIRGLPAFPQAKQLFGRVTPSRYHKVRIPHFMLMDGQTRDMSIPLPRRADQWVPEFTRWASLPRSFAHLRGVLERSQGLRLMGPRSSVMTFQDFKGSRDYDLVDAKSQLSQVLAKAAILNLHHKMSAMADPTTRGKPWFSYVKKVVEVRRDRFIGEVETGLAKSLRTVHGKIGDFQDYERTQASNHFANMPHDLYEVREDSMLSIKSSESFGNLQLTIGEGRDRATGADVVLLDADIDEKGTFFGHIFEVIGHKLTGDRTHPFDVHELLVWQDHRANIGYDLVALQA